MSHPIAMGPRGSAALTGTCRSAMVLDSNAVTSRATPLGHAMSSPSHSVTTMRSSTMKSVGGCVTLYVLLLAQRCSFGCAPRVKIRNLTNTDGAIAGPLPEIHVVKSGSMKDAAVVPDS